MSDHDPADSERSVLSKRDRELVVFEMTEMAKGKIIKWLRTAAAILLVVLSLFGLKAYTDYRSALATIDTLVAERVRDEVAEYRKFTDQIIMAVVDAKSRANEFRNEMDELDGRMVILKELETAYERELASLKTKARERFDDYNLTLVALQVSPGESARLANEQAIFITRSEAFAKKIGLEVAAPPILFERIDEGVQGIFDVERGTYLVNTLYLGKTEYLPEYVAVTCRFMRLHYDRVFGDEIAKGLIDLRLWTGVRDSLPAYLIDANTEWDSDDWNIYGDDHVYRFLKDLEARTDAASVTKLGVTLLTSFDPSWTRDTLPTVLLDINDKEQVVQGFHLLESIKAIWGDD